MPSERTIPKSPAALSIQHLFHRTGPACMTQNDHIAKRFLIEQPADFGRCRVLPTVSMHRSDQADARVEAVLDGCRVLFPADLVG